MKWKSSFVPPCKPLDAPMIAKQKASASSACASFVTSFPNHVPPLHTTKGALQPLQSTRLVMATATVAAGAPRPLFGFLHLLLSFMAGGIFFSSLLAGAATFFAVGQENVKLVWSAARSIFHRVWDVFVFGLNETRLALRMDGRWQFGQAWQVFKSKMGEAKRAAAEGMDAIKAERQFYAGAVGQPGLVVFQYFLDRLMPFSLATQLQTTIVNSLKQVKNDKVRRVTLTEFHAGELAPQLLEARNYELGKDAMAFDVDAKWESQVEFKLSVTTHAFGVRVPVTVRNCTFAGTVRVELTPLVPEPPGYGAILLSLPKVPRIGLDVQVMGGDIMKVPWLKKEILNGLEKQIEEQFLWPKRIVLPSLEVPPNSKTIIPKSELKGLQTTDPLSQRISTLAQKDALREHVSSLQPDMAAVPSSLQVDVGYDSTSTVVNSETRKGQAS